MQVLLTRIAVWTFVAAVILAGMLGVFEAWDMPPPAEVAFCILLIAATLWISEAVPLFVTSFVVLFLSIVWLAPTMRAGEMTVEDGVFLAPFFSDIVLLFLGGFVLSAGLHQFQLDERLAGWILKHAGKTVPQLMLGVMAVTAFLSMWISNTATAAMMTALVLPIVGRLGEVDPWRRAIVLCVPFAANLGGLGTPIGSPPNAIAMQYAREIGIAPDFLTWMVIGLPGVFGMLALSWLVLVTMYRGEAESIALAESADEPPDWSTGMIVVLAGTVLTAIGWITAQFHGLSSGTVAMLPLILFFGTRTLGPKVLRSLSWDVLLLMGGGLCLGKCVAASGLADWIVERLPLEGASAYALMVTFGVVACVMSSVMSNTATANLLMPIILGLDVTPLSPVLIGVAFACSMAMPLPVSTPPNAMAFSSGELTVKDMLIPGGLLTAAGVFLAYTTGWWWWSMVGLH